MSAVQTACSQTPNVYSGVYEEEMYVNLLTMMEKGIIQLYDLEDIKLSLKSCQYEVDDNGKLFIFGNDTHITEGLARATWLFAQDKHLNVWAL